MLLTSLKDTDAADAIMLCNLQFASLFWTLKESYRVLLKKPMLLKYSKKPQSEILAIYISKSIVVTEWLGSEFFEFGFGFNVSGSSSTSLGVSKV